jgi:uncharacterized protein (DUF1499 family)
MNAVAAPTSRRLPVRVGTVLAYAGFALGVVCAVTALLAGPSYRTGTVPLSGAFGAMRWATMGAIAGAVMSLSATFLLAVAGGSAARRATWFGVLGIAINLATAGPPLYMYREAQRLPKIHDITTDTANPPAFVAVVPLRKDARNPVEYKSQTADEQKKGYPDLASLKLDLRFPDAFQRAEHAARAMGWDIVAVVPAEGRIEATATTLLFGFKDDVVIRVRPQDAGSVVDVRSLSRIGGSDIGTNAKRVRAYLRTVQDK